MIRKQVPREPEALAGKRETELKAAKKVYGRRRKKVMRKKGAKKPKPAPKGHSFTAYSKTQGLKDVLHQHFGGKCAYCESRYAADQPGDVEHFRPKSEVHAENGDVLLGYWWLAAVWTNLVPSCNACNRPSTSVVKTGLDSGAQVRITTGKRNRFPIAAGTEYALLPGEEDAEEYLLLHPYFDDARDYLDFKRENEGLVFPRTGRGKRHKRAKASIDVYGLNRAELVQDRREVLRVLQRRMATIQCVLDVLDELEDVEGLEPGTRKHEATVGALMDLVFEELAELEALRRDEGLPYTQMVSQVVEAFLVELELEP